MKHTAPENIIKHLQNSLILNIHGVGVHKEDGRGGSETKS